MFRKLADKCAGLGSALNECAKAQAQWELDASTVILRQRKKLLFLALVPVLVLLVVRTAVAADILPEKIPILGGSKAYMPSFVTYGIFLGSILVGLIAGLITGVIGAGGGYILTPALMSFGVRGIMAVGTDQFHLFAKALMGTTIHRKLGNVNMGLAAWFVLGSVVGVTVGGYINRAIFQYNPAMSDALISLVYVIVLGVLGFYALADWRRLRRPNRAAGAGVEATTGFAKWLRSFSLPPQIAFDQDIVPGGRRISAYPVIVCGLLVGFVVAIMGVGGGFMTFPMFVYGLGVSTFTTVGTSIVQIVFTAGYSSIFQYAIYGFVFYSLSIGMLLGSLIGVQIGAMVTKVVTGSQIRIFYALTILAGFSNRLCALPRKLADLGYISLSRETSGAIETLGTAAFFAIVGVFALWILVVFFRKIRAIRANEDKRIIVSPNRFALGTAGLAIFFIVLAVGLCPLTRHGNLLGWADNFFNQLAKNSAYYIPEAQKRADKFSQEKIDLGVHPKDPVDGAKVAQLLVKNDLEARVVGDGRVRIVGNLAGAAKAALADADLEFYNESAQLEARYQMTANEVMYCWWIVFDALTRRYVQEGRGEEANFTKFLMTKVLEPAYNFRGISPRRIQGCLLPVFLLLGFYIVYTLWYGFSIMYLFEGVGITAAGTNEKKET